MQHIFDSASSVMTLISFLTFVGILLWTFVLRKNDDFAVQSALPFADEVEKSDDAGGESRHV